MTAEDFVARDGFFHPVYLSLVARATVSRHSGTPIMEVYNNKYGYWATKSFLTKAQVVKWLGAGYLRNIKEA